MFSKKNLGLFGPLDWCRKRPSMPWKNMAALAMALLFVSQVHAGPMNVGPPSGAILDLNGQTLPNGGFIQYTVTFTATSTITNISFAFRNDPGFFALDDVSVTDTKTKSSNLLLNGGFELGPNGANAPTDWAYLNSFGAAYSGVVSNGNPHTGTYDYYDGATQAYDGITQAIATTVGDPYAISFYLENFNSNLSLTNFSRLSTNGDVTDTYGNAADVLVYAGAVPTLGGVAPEPGSMMMATCGAMMLFGYGWRRRKTALNK